MAWKKLGLIFNINDYKILWLKSHAMLPTPLVLKDTIRIYYTGRDHNGQSRISFIETIKDDPTRVRYVHERPLLEVGKRGTFDDCGTVGTFVLEHQGAVYLYYNGYNVRNTVPWSNAIGLAVSYDGGVSFEKKFEGPIMDRNTFEPYFAITPCIMKSDGQWHMWYTCGTGWVEVNKKPEPLYVIKYAYSTDGIMWERKNIVCIHPASPEEANARATVIQDGQVLKMWFCYRGSRDFRDGRDSYRIGYAEAHCREPHKWKRTDDQAGISLGPQEYDNCMQAYPYVFQVKNKKYLIYSGNGFGAEGICCAVWE